MHIKHLEQHTQYMLGIFAIIHWAEEITGAKDSEFERILHVWGKLRRSMTLYFCQM